MEISQHQPSHGYHMGLGFDGPCIVFINSWTSASGFIVIDWSIVLFERLTEELLRNNHKQYKKTLKLYGQTNKTVNAFTVKKKKHASSSAYSWKLANACAFYLFQLSTHTCSSLPWFLGISSSSTPRPCTSLFVRSQVVDNVWALATNAIRRCKTHNSAMKL